jgi:uncharacterized membrane protein YdcZ (DUF606 family)
MTWFLLVPVALAAGAAVSMQLGVNSQLRGVAGGPVAAPRRSPLSSAPSRSWP